MSDTQTPEDHQRVREAERRREYDELRTHSAAVAGPEARADLEAQIANEEDER